MAASCPNLTWDDSCAIPIPVEAEAMPCEVPSNLSLAQRKKIEFAHLAPQYDLQCFLWSLGRIGKLRRETAALAKSEIKGPALELCCGTGGVTVELAQRFERVVGVDLSPHMMARAEQRIRRQGINNVLLIERDVSTLLLPKMFFGAIVISLGLHEMPRSLRDHVLQSCFQWLRPGGRLVVFDNCKPKNKLMSMLLRLGGRYMIEEEFFDEYLEWSISKSMQDSGFEILHRRPVLLSCLEIVVGQRPAVAQLQTPSHQQ